MGDGWTRRRVLASAAAALPVAGLPAVGAVACTSGPAPVQLTNTVLIRGARIFDGERVAVDADSVVVERGLIAAVGRGLVAPAGAFVQDGAGRTLLPGLIDAHVHTTVQTAAEAPPFGVTTMIDMFTPAAQLPLFRRQRDSIERVAAADVWSAGTLVTAPGGHGSALTSTIPTLAVGADPAVFVRALPDEGSDFIKIIVEDGSVFGRPLPTLAADQVRGVVAAAHANGVLAAVHVSSAEGVAIAAAAGADLLAHAPVQPIDHALVDDLRRRDVAVIAPGATTRPGASG